jgi:beta-lactamase class D
MKNKRVIFYHFFLLSLLSVCVLYAAPKKLWQYFEDQDGCFILYDVTKSQTVQEYNKKRCAKREPAFSTFKIALALIAFDKGVLKDENTPFKWDGKDHGMPAWNRDQTATSWMKDSVVWVSQILTKRLGKKTLEKYLKDFGYGTADMSGGIETAWLTHDSTLLISADEQVKFLTRLWKGELPVSKKAIELTQKISFIEMTSKGYSFSGKTGSGTVGSDQSRLGWFVSHFEKGSESFVSVVTFTGTKKRKENRAAGYEAKDKMKKIVTDLEMFF